MAEASFIDQTLLITGGTGSFGRKLAERVLLEKLFAKVIIFSRDEWKQSDMRDSSPLFREPRIRYFIGDVRDQARLERAFSTVDVVVHAAALKQVPVAEYNPSEFVKTNVLGAMNLVEAALRSPVKRLIALSTDKAVNPTNLYGASKLCQDKLLLASNAYAGIEGSPMFSVVRYGNVAGTRGSVIPLWRRQLLEGGTSLSLTDLRMTRFWITLDEAVSFVLNSLKRMRGGEVFIPKIPSFRVVDLKRAVAPGAETKITGLRPGEKLHEVLLSEDEARHALEEEDQYVILPTETFRKSLPSFTSPDPYRGRILDDPYSYTSDKNPNFLEVEELRQKLEEIL